MLFKEKHMLHDLQFLIGREGVPPSNGENPGITKSKYLRYASYVVKVGMLLQVFSKHCNVSVYVARKSLIVVDERKPPHYIHKEWSTR